MSDPEPTDEPNEAERTPAQADAVAAAHAVDHAAPPTRGQLLLYGFISGALRGACKVWFRARARGLDQVPKDGAFVLAPVHRSNLDFAMVLLVTKRRMRYLAKDSLWKGGGFWAKLFTALGGIPVARGTADREALRTCIAVVEAGEPLVVFPEGTRQHGPEVQHCFDGPAFIQSRTGVPIVPVGIGGSEAAMPKGSKIPKPRRVRLVIGPALMPIEADGPKARRTAIRDRTAELKTVIQGLFDEAQRDAGTPNH